MSNLNVSKTYYQGYFQEKGSKRKVEEQKVQEQDQRVWTKEGKCILHITIIIRCQECGMDWCGWIFACLYFLASQLKSS